MTGPNSWRSIEKGLVVLTFALIRALVAQPGLKAGPPQFSPCDHESWRAVVGVVESVDPKQKTLDIRIRGGAREVPRRWENAQGGTNTAEATSTLTSNFSLGDFWLQVRPDSNQKAKLILTSETGVFQQVSSSLRPTDAKQIQSGDSVLIVLAGEHCWPSSEQMSSKWQFDTKIDKVVLLQACIEESCSKAKCKGKSDCKERVCDCPRAP